MPAHRVAPEAPLPHDSGLLGSADPPARSNDSRRPAISRRLFLGTVAASAAFYGGGQANAAGSGLAARPPAGFVPLLPAK